MPDGKVYMVDFEKFTFPGIRATMPPLQHTAVATHFSDKQRIEFAVAIEKLEDDVVLSAKELADCRSLLDDINHVGGRVQGFQWAQALRRMLKSRKDCTYYDRKLLGDLRRRLLRYVDPSKMPAVGVR